MTFLTHLVSAEEDVANLALNITDSNSTSNSTNSTGGPKSSNPFISEIAGPLLLVTTILFFLSILYVLVCLCLIRCGSVRFDPVNYPDGRIYFCLGVRFLSSWCYLPLCGGGGTGGATSSQRGLHNMTDAELRSYPPPPPWLAGDHNELISSMDDFGIYIPIFDRSGRKKALVALLDNPNLFYGDPNATLTGGINEVLPMVMRRFSASQGDNSDTQEMDPERMVSVGRIICSPAENLRDMNATGANHAMKIQNNLGCDGIMPPPQDRPMDGSSSYVKKTSFLDALNTADHNNTNSDDKLDPAIANESNLGEESKDSSIGNIELCLDHRSSTCPICLEDLDSSTSIIVSNPSVCNHIFHRDCLVEWLSNNHASCPCCRMDWVSNVMLWDALRWAILREQDDEKERRKEEKKLRRLQRRHGRKCIRGLFGCCLGRGGGRASIALQSNIAAIETPESHPDIEQDEERGMAIRNEPSPESVSICYDDIGMIVENAISQESHPLSLTDTNIGLDHDEIVQEEPSVESRNMAESSHQTPANHQPIVEPISPDAVSHDNLQGVQEASNRINN